MDVGWNFIMFAGDNFIAVPQLVLLILRNDALTAESQILRPSVIFQLLCLRYYV